MTPTVYRNDIDDIAKEVGSPVGGRAHLLLNGKAQETKSAESGKRMVVPLDSQGHYSLKWGSCLSAVVSICSGGERSESASGRAISWDMAGVPCVVWRGNVLYCLSGAFALESRISLP
jgi:hypothetical protein